MKYYRILKNGKPYGVYTTNFFAAFVGIEFLKEVDPKHEWDIEEKEIDDNEAGV